MHRSLRSLAEDRKLAELQVICPVSEVRLGTKGMGTPIKVDVKGSSIMICCEGCRSGVLEEPEKILGNSDEVPSGAA